MNGRRWAEEERETAEEKPLVVVGDPSVCVDAPSFVSQPACRYTEPLVSPLLCVFTRRIGASDPSGPEPGEYVPERAGH